VQLLSKDEASEVRFYCEYELLDKDFFGSFSFDLRFSLSKFLADYTGSYEDVQNKSDNFY